MTYEENIKEIEDILFKLEDGNLTLEESLACFEKGVQNLQECNNMLNETKGKIVVLKQKLDEIIEEDFN